VEVRSRRYSTNWARRCIVILRFLNQFGEP
jgi:hypothetical protein